ncbi:MAG TPA: citrate synthase/methylcitrate synthase [Thermoanaerobaculia bacterium]|jgi:citrate synthase|nr:citrate synthase/methylcitrate synthase [Thermoanaerobaculia bacterium]
MNNRGLEGVVAAETKLSHVDERGELIIAGYRIDDLAPNATFEETVWLLWNGELPDPRELANFRRELAERRSTALTIERPSPLVRGEKVPKADEGSCTAPLDAIRMLLPPGDDPLDIVAKFPTIIAAVWRLSRKQEPIAPNPSLGHAANYLYMLTGEVPSDEKVRALETYLNTVVDHGLNASTFTARVITSTGSDLVSAVVGGVGALKGPLHGGAPGPALDMVFEIGDASRAEGYLRKKIEAGEKLMGFGHRVYKVRDPRADVLAAAAERMFARGGDRSLYALAGAVEREALRLLEEYKPGRRLQTNVEFYTALLLHGIGLEVPLFTPTFAISRVAGWLAHALEQRAANRLIRPQSEYVGPRARTWTAPAA